MFLLFDHGNENILRITNCYVANLHHPHYNISLPSCFPQRVENVCPHNALDSITEEMIVQAVEKTPGCKGFLMDKKGTKAPARDLIKKVADLRELEDLKTRILRWRDLKPHVEERVNF